MCGCSQRHWRESGNCHIPPKGLMPHQTELGQRRWVSSSGTWLLNVRSASHLLRSGFIKMQIPKKKMQIPGPLSTPIELASPQVLPRNLHLKLCPLGIFFFLRFYLFIHERHRERGRDTGRGRSRLHAGSLTWDSILGLQDHTLGCRQH